MDVVVLAKYVPNPSGLPPEIGPDFRLRREDANGGLDPSDEPGVEVAVRLREERGGEVTAVSVGPELATRALWRALALGADRAVLVSDDALCGADALATARAFFFSWAFLWKPVRPQTFSWISSERKILRSGGLHGFSLVT